MASHVIGRAPFPEFVCHMIPLYSACNSCIDMCLRIVQSLSWHGVPLIEEGWYHNICVHYVVSQSAGSAVLVYFFGVALFCVDTCQAHCILVQSLKIVVIVMPQNFWFISQFAVVWLHPDSHKLTNATYQMNFSQTKFHAVLSSSCYHFSPPFSSIHICTYEFIHAETY